MIELEDLEPNDKGMYSLHQYYFVEEIFIEAGIDPSDTVDMTVEQGMKIARDLTIAKRVLDA